MTAETITREAVAKAIIDGLEGVEGSGQSDPGIWHLDDDLTDVGIDGHCDMLAAADAVLALVDLPTRLAAAEARALPAPRLMRTVEEVRAVQVGSYIISRKAPWPPNELALKGLDGNWWEIASELPMAADDMVGAWIVRLPDIAIPSEEG